MQYANGEINLHADGDHLRPKRSPELTAYINKQRDTGASAGTAGTEDGREENSRDSSFGSGTALTVQYASGQTTFSVPSGPGKGGIMISQKVITTYQDPEVENIETYWKKLERLESLLQTGAITRAQYFAQWISLEKIYDIGARI